MTLKPKGGRNFGLKELLLALFVIVIGGATQQFFAGRTDLATVVNEPNSSLRIAFTLPDAANRQGGLDEALAAAIDGAQTRVDVAAYDFNLQSLTDALLRAHAAGVTVRMVIDADNNYHPQIAALRASGIEVVEDSRTQIMHNKFVIIDEAQVWTGSWNFTFNGTFRNDNNVVVVHSPALAENYTAEFEEMFLAGQFGPTSPHRTPHPRIEIGDVLVENYFAPEDNPQAAILAVLEEAQESIHFMAFAFTDDEIAQLLVRKLRAGLQVRGVMEARNINSMGSDYDALRQAGVDLLSDGNPYMMHHKVIIVDEAIVITGSYNFTASAAGYNDENVLIIHSADAARLYMEEFRRVYREAEGAQ